MILLNQITDEALKEGNYVLYIYTPFCGTCRLASSMLRQIESAHGDIFYEMNASLYPEFMHQHQIESVPCLFIMVNHEVKEKIYTFHSIPNIYTYLVKHNQL